jgi:glycerol-3-phosphate cytidylyltransferase-like family protein
MGHIQLLLQSKADMTNMIICILQSSKVVMEGDIHMDGG